MSSLKFGWSDASPACSQRYVLPAVMAMIASHSQQSPLRILDIGCGNGSAAISLAKLGHDVLGFDASEDGVQIARGGQSGVTFLHRRIEEGDIRRIIGGSVDIVISLEVIEHLFDPDSLFREAAAALKPGGALIISTPYHGYAKNLAISICGGWDRHFHVERVGGHVKYFSRSSLQKMARANGFVLSEFSGVGRVRWMWKSMVMAFHHEP